jgi:hypothetical protein
MGSPYLTGDTNTLCGQNVEVFYVNACGTYGDQWTKLEKPETLALRVQIQELFPEGRNILNNKRITI